MYKVLRRVNFKNVTNVILFLRITKYLAFQLMQAKVFANENFVDDQLIMAVCQG